MPRVEVDGVTIHYEVTGKGRPVLLLHGFPDTGRLWRHQVPALAEAGFKGSFPSYAATAVPTSPNQWRPTPCPSSLVTSWAFSPTLGSRAPMWWATTGAQPLSGDLGRWRLTT